MQARATHSAPTHILLVDDHAFTSLGARSFLERQSDFAVVGTAGSSAEAFTALAHHSIDVAVIDLVLGSEDGLDLVKQIAGRYPSVHILVLSMHDESIYAERALRSGALGYVMKSESPGVLIEAIRTVRTGQIHVSEAVRRQQEAGPRAHGNDPIPIDVLSDRELTVFRWLGEGLATREIALALHISPKTVHTYRERIKGKLGLGSAAELVRHAILFARPMPGQPPFEDEGRS